MAAQSKLAVVLRINKINKGLAQNYIDGAFLGSGKYYRLVRGNDSESVGMMADTL